MGYMGFGMNKEVYTRKPKPFFQKFAKIVEKDNLHYKDQPQLNRKKLNQVELDKIKQQVLKDNRKRLIQSFFWAIIAILFVVLLFNVVIHKYF
jgi:hypothetical protein